VLERLHGEIRYSRIMKDRRGKADRRRIYSLKTEALKLTDSGYRTLLCSHQSGNKFSNPPAKRLFSPDTLPECTELVKRGRTNIFNCYCGLKMSKPAKTGELVTCECSSQHMLCVCQHVFKIGEKGEAVCNSCHRQTLMLGLDMTV